MIKMSKWSFSGIWGVESKKFNNLLLILISFNGLGQDFVKVQKIMSKKGKFNQSTVALNIVLIALTVEGRF